MTGPAAAAGSFALGDRSVNRMGFGSMRLTGTRPFHGGEPRDRDQSIAVLRRARELGVDHVDTAAFYFSQRRSANEIVNAALSPYDDDLVVVTKVGPARDSDGEWLPRARPDQLRGQVEDNLRQLGLDVLPVVNFRAEDDQPVDEHVGALADLVDAGLVRHIGVSAVSPAQLEQALAVAPLVCVQNRLSLGAADSVEVLERCGTLGIAFVAFFSLARADPAGARAVDRVVDVVAAEVGATPAQVRLAWTLHPERVWRCLACCATPGTPAGCVAVTRRGAATPSLRRLAIARPGRRSRRRRTARHAPGPHVLVIPGTGDPGHVDENVDAAAVSLTPEQLDRLARRG